MIGIAGVLLVQDGHYVLQKRDHHSGIANPGMYSIWGGAFEGLESPEQAAVRELFEETGVVIGVVDLIFLTQFSIKGMSERSKGQIVDAYVYAAEIGSDVVVNCYEGEKLVRIKSLAEIPEKEQEPQLIAAIGAYRERKKD